VRAHALLIEVKAGLGLADERAVFLEGEEVFTGLRIDGVAVGICVGRRSISARSTRSSVCGFPEARAADSSRSTTS